MNLQKLISTRAAHRKVAEGQLKRIIAELCSEEINSIVEGILEKVALLKQLNEKILSQTDVADIENEIVDTEEYMIDLESSVRKARREMHRRILLLVWRIFVRTITTTLHHSTPYDKK